MRTAIGRDAGFIRLSRGLLVLGTPLLAAGLYAAAVGAFTLTWPRAQATILEAEAIERDSIETVPGTDKYRGGRRETRVVATFRVRYRYRVGAREYVGDGVEPADLGLQTSAAARWFAMRYAPGQTVLAAYDPHDPARAYLRPGPSSPALALVGFGGTLVGAGLWLRVRRR